MLDQDSQWLRRKRKMDNSLSFESLLIPLNHQNMLNASQLRRGKFRETDCAVSETR
jgi:hypothetical protein